MTDYFSDNTKGLKNVMDANSMDPALIAIFHAKSEHKERIRKRDVYDSKKKLDSISREIKNRCDAVKFHVFEIGQLLCEAKENLEHGSFKSWIKDNLPFSYGTAVNSMRVYKGCIGIPEVLDCYKTSQLYEICSPKFPGKLREHLFENSKGDGFVDGSKKDLVEMALKYKKGKIKLKGPEIQNFLKNRLQKIEISKCMTEINAVIRFLKDRAKRISEIESDQHLTNPIIKELEENKNEDYEEYETSPKEKCKIKIGSLIRDLERFSKNEL